MMQEQFDRLGDVASKLNEATDRMMASIREFDLDLLQLSLGVVADGPPYQVISNDDFEEDESALDGVGGIPVTRSCLTYGRFGKANKFTIHVVRRIEVQLPDGSYSVIGRDFMDLSSLCRTEKMLAIATIPGLIDALLGVSVSLEERITQATDVVEGLSRTLRETVA